MMGASDYSVDRLTAGEAQLLAEQIAFGPVLFHICRILRDRGVLAYLLNAREGATLDELCCEARLSEYALEVLLESALTAGVVLLRDGRWFLGKVGWFLQRSEMTRVDMDFVGDVCYRGLEELEQSLEEGKPAGLRHFGEWPTIYEGLGSLPPKALKSWLAFDHYYSDQSFPAALDLVFKREPKRLLDVGGNTGRFALRCVNHSPEVRVTVMDLPGQLELMRENVRNSPHHARIDGYAADMLSPQLAFPTGYDAIWMSQFLDCFSDSDATRILRCASKSMTPTSRLYILEPIWDRQRFGTAAFSQTQISPYFTAMANGCSKLFNSKTLEAIIGNAGLVIERVEDGLGVGHSLFICAPYSNK